MTGRRWDDSQKTIGKTEAINIFHDVHPGKQLNKNSY